VYLIERLWIDTMENRDAYGYKPIGIVIPEEEVVRICTMEHIPKSKYPWPLKYASEHEGDTVPRFRASKMNNLEGMTFEQLLNIKGE